MGKKALYIILAVVVLVALYYFIGPVKEVNESPTPGDELPIEEDFGSKIVYTTNTDLDAGPFEADCEARGGVFNDCGTTCEPEAEFCAEVCAYTCDLSGEENEPENIENEEELEAGAEENESE
jgi:hypothetical protein